MDVDDSEVGDSPHCSAAGARLDGQWASEMRTKTTRLCRIAADTYVGPGISHAAFETVPATDTVGYLRDLLAVLYVIPRVASIMLGMTVRERMLGAWTLRDFVEAPVDGSPDARPLGAHPRGTILYTSDGFMSAQAAQPVSDHATNASSGLYLAYSGPFDVDEDTAIVRHHLEVSLNPELVGSVQLRQVSFGDDGSLSLDSLEAISLAGRLVVVRVVWSRR